MPHSDYTDSENEQFARFRTNAQGQYPRNYRYGNQALEQELDDCRRDLRECQQDRERYRRSLKKCQEKKEVAEQDAKIAEETAKITQEKAMDEIESLEIRLFHRANEAKDYDEAEGLYRQVVTHKGLSIDENLKILHLTHSFVSMLAKEGKLEEAEPKAQELWAVWKKKRDSTEPLSEEAKQCYRLLCSILSSLQRFDDAEAMHSKMYNKRPRDAWTLENGDALCQTLAKQKRFEDAKRKQKEVWDERRRKLGKRDDLTIQSGVRVIEFLERLIASGGNDDGYRAQTRLNEGLKKTFENEHELILEEIWDTRAHPEPIPEIMDAGFKLGNIYFGRKEYGDARAVYEAVWEAKNKKYGEKDPKALSAGSMLGQALHYEGTRETVSKAIRILQAIWYARQSISKPGDIETIQSGELLVQAYRSNSEWARADQVVRWIVEQKTLKHGQSAPETVDARWRLAKGLYSQGSSRYREAERVLRELYLHLKGSSPRSSLTFECGYMLAHSLSTQEESANEALIVIRSVFKKKQATGERDPFYLKSGHLFGSLLARMTEFPQAELILEPLWTHQSSGSDEERIRLMCGDLYGQCLFRQQKLTDARETLESVILGQRIRLPAGDPQIAETAELLQKVNDKIKETEPKAAPKKGVKANKGVPRTRRGVYVKEKNGQKYYAR